MTGRRLRLVQVGVGGWGQTWLDRVVGSPHWELAGIVDTDEAALAAARTRHGLSTDQVFRSVGEAAASTTADAALVVVPAAAHLAVACDVFDAGWHAIVEKPLADTMTNARELVSRADAADRRLMVSQNYRFRRGAQALAGIVAQGWLGRLHVASVQVHKQLHFVLPDEPHGFTAYRFARDAAVHHLDQIRFCLGVEVVRVHASTDNPSYSWFAEPPMVAATLEVEGGGIVQFYGSWIARARQTTFDGDWTAEFENGQVRWSAGRLLVRPVEPWLTIQMDGLLEREDGWMEADLPTEVSEDRTRVLEVFAESLAAGGEPPVNGRDNLRTVALAFAVEESARTGRPQLVADYLRSPPAG